MMRDAVLPAAEGLGAYLSGAALVDRSYAAHQLAPFQFCCPKPYQSTGIGEKPVGEKDGDSDGGGFCATTLQGSRQTDAAPVHQPASKHSTSPGDNKFVPASKRRRVTPSIPQPVHFDGQGQGMTPPTSQPTSRVNGDCAPQLNDDKVFESSSELDGNFVLPVDRHERIIDRLKAAQRELLQLLATSPGNIRPLLCRRCWGCDPGASADGAAPYIVLPARGNETAVSGNKRRGGADALQSRCAQSPRVLPALISEPQTDAGAIGPMSPSAQQTAIPAPQCAAGLGPAGAAPCGFTDWVALAGVKSVVKPKLQINICGMDGHERSSQAVAAAPTSSAQPAASSPAHRNPTAPHGKRSHARSPTSLHNLFNMLISNPQDEEVEALAHETEVLLPPRSRMLMSDICSLGPLLQGSDTLAVRKCNMRCVLFQAAAAQGMSQRCRR